MESWYGGEYDQLVPLTGERRSLHFIHRTATDFLLYTEEGHSIMAHCSSSKFELTPLQMNAWLASSCLLSWYTPTSRNSLGSLLKNLHSIQREFQTSITWDARRWNLLVSHCQRLSNARRLYTTDRDRARLCMGRDFLLASTFHSLTDFVHLALNKDNIDADTKFEILLRASWARKVNPEEKSSLVKKLLKAGADPRRRGYVRFVSATYDEFCKHMSYSPMTAYLHYISRLHIMWPEVSHAEASAAVDNVTALFADGLTGFKQICFFLVPAGYPKVPLDFAKAVAWGACSGWEVLACFPVRSLVVRWVQKLRARTDLADSVSSLEKAMGTQNDYLTLYHKLWLVNVNKGPMDANGVRQVPDMEFGEFPATEWRAQKL